MSQSRATAALDGSANRIPSPALDGFLALVRDLRDAQCILEQVRLGSAVHATASAFVAEHRDRVFDLTLPCMLSCGGTLVLATTVGEYVQLCGTPRGICGRH